MGGAGRGERGGGSEESICGGIIRAGSLKGQLPILIAVIWFKFIHKWEGRVTIYCICSYMYYFIPWSGSKQLLQNVKTTIPASNGGIDQWLFLRTKCPYFSNMVFLSVMERSAICLQNFWFVFFVQIFLRDSQQGTRTSTFNFSEIFLFALSSVSVTLSFTLNKGVLFIPLQYLNCNFCYTRSLYSCLEILFLFEKGVIECKSKTTKYEPYSYIHIPLRPSQHKKAERGARYVMVSSIKEVHLVGPRTRPSVW